MNKKIGNHVLVSSVKRDDVIVWTVCDSLFEFRISFIRPKRTFSSVLQGYDFFAVLSKVFRRIVKESFGFFMEVK